LLNKVGLSGVGDITDLVNKGELEDVDGIDDIKDFINEKYESARFRGTPFKTRGQYGDGFMLETMGVSGNDDTNKRIPT
jgi:hypothetical protein